MPGPFGVELPESFDSQPSPDAQSETVESAPDNEGGESPKEDPKSPEVIDLDKLERVRFKGRELTRKELEDGWLMREDYTRKTQSLSEARKQFEEHQKFTDNFQYDIEKVIENPALMDQLRQIYPPQFVKAAEKILARLGHDTGERTESVQLPPDVQEKLQKVDSILSWKEQVEQKVQQANEAKADAQIETWFSKFGQKYSEADEEVVNAKAVILAEQLEKEGKSISESDLEKLFKADHEHREKRYAERYRSQIAKQKEAQKQGHDIGAGGGVPSTPPIKAKTIKEATDQFLSGIEKGHLS